MLVGLPVALSLLSLMITVISFDIGLLSFNVDPTNPLLSLIQYVVFPKNTTDATDNMH